MTTTKRITLEMLKHRLEYQPESGNFIWRNPFRKAMKGTVAGSVANTGYLVINTARDIGPLLAHRLAWLYMTGEWPEEMIDHINGDRTDNRWCNLRAATSQMNLHNIWHANKNNSSGVRGVYANKKGTFAANIFCDGRKTYLGTFKRIEQAEQAYLAAKAARHLIPQTNGAAAHRG